MACDHPSEDLFSVVGRQDGSWQYACRCGERAEILPDEAAGGFDHSAKNEIVRRAWPVTRTVEED
jgi:hypothetical protein